jgi:hypothetical protein
VRTTVRVLPIPCFTRARTAIRARRSAAALGLRGRARPANDPAERARWAITKQIQSAIDRLDRAHPALARHLRTSIKTGRYCSYEPERLIEWQL